MARLEPKVSGNFLRQYYGVVEALRTSLLFTATKIGV